MWPLILWSRTLNATLGGNFNETLSARSWREGNVEWVNRIDRWFGVGHCREAHEWHQKYVEKSND